jgi:hypothetical protein
MVLSMAQMGNDETLWSIDAKAGFAQWYAGQGRWQVNTNRKMKAVSCASAHQVWGIDVNGKACVLTPSPVQSSTTSAQRVAVGGATGLLWVYAGSITWTDSSGKTGTIPAPQFEFTSFAATDPAKGGYALWATTINGLPKPPKLATLFWDGSAWKDSGGPGFNEISVGRDNSVWGYLHDAQPPATPGLYRFNSQGKWVLASTLPAGLLLQSFTALDAYDIWAMGDDAKPYRWNGQFWTQQDDGSPNWIRCGADGVVYGRNAAAGSQAPLQRFNGFTQWVPMPVTFTNLVDLASRDAGSLWFSHWENRLSVMGSWPGYVWQDMPGGAVLATISGAPDGTVWGTDANKALLRFNGSAWDTMPGQATQISVGSANLVWSIDVNGNAQRWTGSGWEAHGNPGSALTSIAALGDGTVLGTAPVQIKVVGPYPPLTEGQVFLWDGTKWVATGFPADQFAGTDLGHLAGVISGSLVVGNPVPSFVIGDVQNVSFSPQTQVYPRTVMTLSWDAFPSAANYDARINGAGGSFEATVTGTSISYTLQRGDMFSFMGGWVHALDGAGNIVAQGSASFYCGNNQG